MYNNTTRFSKTVDNYIKYRPGYPESILELMQAELGLQATHRIADIGAGTGKLTQLLLKSNAPTYAIEPNADMLHAARQLLEHHPSFHPIEASAEQTTLPNQSVDFITAGQAFHWFDKVRSRNEFLRILKPGGYCLIIWNKRADEQSDFMYAYNEYLKNYSTDLNLINLRNVDEPTIQTFLGQEQFQFRQYDHYQAFDWEGLKGRYLSCSYALHEGHDGHEKALAALSNLFEQFAIDGQVKMWYNAVVYYAKMEREG